MPKSRNRGPVTIGPGELRTLKAVAEWWERNPDAPRGPSTSHLSKRDGVSRERAGRLLQRLAARNLITRTSLVQINDTARLTAAGRKILAK